MSDPKVNLFGDSTKDDIRVGYISTTRGYVTGVTVDEANIYAKKDPGTKFILQNRDYIKYISINEVNELTTEVLTTETKDQCAGVQWEAPLEPAEVIFAGGGGVGVVGNPIFGLDNSLLAVDLVSGGFGYKYAPVTTLKDVTGRGAGAHLISIVGDISETQIIYDKKEDFEYYEIETPDADDLPDNTWYGPDGKEIGKWDPQMYTGDEGIPFDVITDQYIDVLHQIATGNIGGVILANAGAGVEGSYTGDGSASGGIDGSAASAGLLDESQVTGVDEVEGEETEGTGGEVTESSAATEGSSGVTFGNVNFPSSPSLNERYSLNGVTWRWNGTAWIPIADTGSGSGGSGSGITGATNFPSNPYVNQRYRAGGVSWDWNGTAWIPISNIIAGGTGGTVSGGVLSHTKVQEHKANVAAAAAATAAAANSSLPTDSIVGGTGLAAQAQKLVGLNPNGLVEGAGVFWWVAIPPGPNLVNFGGKDREGYTGKRTNKLYKVEHVAWNEIPAPVNAKGKVLDWSTNGWMNTHAVSPVRPSHAKGTDHAQEMFTLEWDVDFPWDGEYSFKGCADNTATVYLDNEEVTHYELGQGGAKGKILSLPTIVKKEVTKGIHLLRIDLKNTPIVETVKVQASSKTYGSLLQVEDLPDVAAGSQGGVTYDDLQCYAKMGRFFDVNKNKAKYRVDASFNQPDGSEVEVEYKVTSASAFVNKIEVKDLFTEQGPSVIELPPVPPAVSQREASAKFSSRGSGRDTKYYMTVTGNDLVEVQLEFRKHRDDSIRGTGHSVNAITIQTEDAPLELLSGPNVTSVNWPFRDTMLTVKKGTFKHGKEYEITFSEARFQAAAPTPRIQYWGLTDDNNVRFANPKRLEFDDFSANGWDTNATFTIDSGNVVFGPDCRSLVGSRGMVTMTYTWNDNPNIAGKVLTQIHIGHTKWFQTNETTGSQTQTFYFTTEAAPPPQVSNNDQRLSFFDADVSDGASVSEPDLIGDVRAHFNILNIEQLTAEVPPTPGGPGLKQLDKTFTKTVEVGRVYDVTVSNAGQGLMGNTPAPIAALKAVDIVNQDAQIQDNTQASITKRNVFNTVAYQKAANRRLWRTNVNNRNGFMNEYGICPFDTYHQLPDNPYAGTHTIRWNHVNFPISGNYTIRIGVDDNVDFTIAKQVGGGSGEVVKITKQGYTFPAGGGIRSTGVGNYVRYIEAGRYTIVADLTQIPGGKFGFGKLTHEGAIHDYSGEGLNPMALAISIDTTVAERDEEVPKSWHANPLGIALNIRAPLPPAPVQKQPFVEGRCPRNPVWSTRFPGAKNGTWYPVRFDSWKEFHNKYGMSPVPPLPTGGSDHGGIWFTNSWDVEIEFPGWYNLKAVMDDEGSISVDGVEVMSLTDTTVVEYKEELIRFETVGMHEITIKLRNNSTTEKKIVDLKILNARDWLNVTPTFAGGIEKDVSFKVTSASAFVNSIDVKGLFYKQGPRWENNTVEQDILLPEVPASVDFEKVGIGLDAKYYLKAKGNNRVKATLDFRNVAPIFKGPVPQEVTPTMEFVKRNGQYFLKVTGNRLVDVGFEFRYIEDNSVIDYIGLRTTANRRFVNSRKLEFDDFSENGFDINATFTIDPLSNVTFSPDGTKLLGKGTATFTYTWNDDPDMAGVVLDEIKIGDTTWVQTGKSGSVSHTINVVGGSDMSGGVAVGSISVQTEGNALTFQRTDGPRTLLDGWPGRGGVVTQNGTFLNGKEYLVTFSKLSDAPDPIIGPAGSLDNTSTDKPNQRINFFDLDTSGGATSGADYFGDARAYFTATTITQLSPVPARVPEPASINSITVQTMTSPVTLVNNLTDSVLATWPFKGSSDVKEVILENDKRYEITFGGALFKKTGTPRIKYVGLKTFNDLRFVNSKKLEFDDFSENGFDVNATFTIDSGDVTFSEDGTNLLGSSGMVTMTYTWNDHPDIAGVVLDEIKIGDTTWKQFGITGSITRTFYFSSTPASEPKFGGQTTPTLNFFDGDTSAGATPGPDLDGDVRAYLNVVNVEQMDEPLSTGEIETTITDAKTLIQLDGTPPILKDVVIGRVYEVEVSNAGQGLMGNTPAPIANLKAQGGVLMVEDLPDVAAGSQGGITHDDLVCSASKGRFFDVRANKCKYVIDAPATGQVTIGGVTYSGPKLFAFRNPHYGDFLNTQGVAPDYPVNDNGQTNNYVWSNVDFPVTGQYKFKFANDAHGSVYLDGEPILDGTFDDIAGISAVDVQNWNPGLERTLHIPKGKYTIAVAPTGRLGLTDVHADGLFKKLSPGYLKGTATWDRNPSAMALSITTEVDILAGTTGSSDPWMKNPISISAELVPPPCPRLVEGGGVIEEVVVIDPGNGYPTSEGPGIPTLLELDKIEVDDPGINYNCKGDKIVIEPSNGAQANIICDNFGRISEVEVTHPGIGFTGYPDIYIDSPTGVAFSAKPKFKIHRDPIPKVPGMPPDWDGDVDKLLQVTDLVGLKQTGYYDGRPYYGAVFYKDGVRYAGYYETAGRLVQIYDTLQESIDGMVTTPPSAIQRQGTDISSDDTNLDIPNTPDTLI